MAERTATKSEEAVPNLVLPEVARANPLQKASYRLALGFQSVALVLDVITIFVAFWIAYELRYTYRIGAMVPIGRDTLEFRQWAQHALVAIIFSLLVFFARGVYQVSRKMSWGD